MVCWGVAEGVVFSCLLFCFVGFSWFWGLVFACVLKFLVVRAAGLLVV